MINYCEGFQSLQTLHKDSFKTILLARYTSANKTKNYIVKSYDKVELEHYVLLREFVEEYRAKFTPIKEPHVAKVAAIIETDLTYEFVCQLYHGHLLQLQVMRPQKVWTPSHAFLIISCILATLTSCRQDYLFSLSPEDIFYQQKSEADPFILPKNIDLGDYEFYLHEPTCESFMKVKPLEDVKPALQN